MNEAPEYTKSEVDSFVDEIYTYEEINFLDVTFTNAFLYSSFPPFFLKKQVHFHHAPASLVVYNRFSEKSWLSSVRFGL